MCECIELFGSLQMQTNGKVGRLMPLCIVIR